MSVCEFVGRTPGQQEILVEERFEDSDDLLLQFDIDNLEFELYELNRIIEEYYSTIPPEEHSL